MSCLAPSLQRAARHRLGRSLLSRPLSSLALPRSRAAAHRWPSCPTTLASGHLRDTRVQALPAHHHLAAWSSPSRSYACGCACSCGAPPAKKLTTAYIALGSNLGDRVAEIEKACNLMDQRGIRVKRTSSLWETEPMYVEDQDRFLNGACEVGSTCSCRTAEGWRMGHSLLTDACIYRSRRTSNPLPSWTSSRPSRMTWAATRLSTRALATLTSTSCSTATRLSSMSVSMSPTLVSRNASLS